jgi:hypothetical protein
MKALLKTLAVTTMVVFTNTAMSYGAIAVSDEQGLKSDEVGYGFGTGDSAAEAKSDAISACKKAGNDSCEAVIAYKLCGAFAVSKSYRGVGEGDSEKNAEKNALKECGDACRVVTSGCDI